MKRLDFELNGNSYSVYPYGRHWRWSTPLNSRTGFSLGDAVLHDSAAMHWAKKERKKP